MRLLRGNSYGAIVSVAGAHGDATDGLHRRVGDGDGIGTEGQCFDEIGWFAQSACDNGAPPARGPGSWALKYCHGR